MKFLMTLFAALLMVGSAQAGGFKGGPKGPQGHFLKQDVDDTKGYFWNLKAGSSSAFVMVFTIDGAEIPGPELTIKVQAVNNKICTFRQEAAGHGSELHAGTADGYWCWGQMVEGKFKPVMALFKLGAKAGDTWDGWAGGRKEGQTEVTVKYVGNEELKTPFGTLKDVIHVQAVVKDGPTLDYWFAPGKGMVKSVTSNDGKEARRFELSAFTEGK